MASSKPAPPVRRRPAAVVIAAVVLLGAAGVVFATRSSEPGSRAHVAAEAVRTLASSSLAPVGGAPLVPGLHDGGSDGGGHDGLGPEDGVLPDGVTVFRDDVPGVANLDPALLAALRRAATDAAEDGVAFTIHSAWRSRAYQEQLLRDAVAEHGSEEEAARWVAPPDRSAHVSGEAIDLESSAASWLSEHGAAYGLCQIYDNESWHYELRPDAVDGGCPARYADAAHDPRMQP